MLSRKSAEILVDLIANRLDCMEVIDREDRRVQRDLETAMKELSALLRRPGAEAAQPSALSLVPAAA
jgi:hypothetical protein